MSDQDSLQEELDRALLPGTLLQETRESQGLSVPDAALALKVTESYVRALESNDYEHLPQATFVRGYLKNYAKLLGLNADEIVGAYDQHMDTQGDVFRKPNVEKSIKPLRAHSTPSPVNALILILVISLGGLSYYLWNNWLKPDASTTVIAEESVVDGVASELEVVLEVLTDSEGHVELEEPVPELTQEAQVVVTEIKEEPEVIEVAEPVMPEDPLKNLVISFKGECWVEITDASGDILVSSVQQSGSSVDLEVLPPVNVRFGNSPAVDQILFDGELVPNPKTRSRVASLELKASRQG